MYEMWMHFLTPGRDFTVDPCLALSRLQTIDKVGQLFGRGLVSEVNRLMKSLNYDTCHLSSHDCDVKKMADDKVADAFMLHYFLTAKQHKKRTIWVRRWSLDR